MTRPGVPWALAILLASAGSAVAAPAAIGRAVGSAGSLVEPEAAHARSAVQDNDEVREARVEGNQTYREEQILGYLRIEVGERYDAARVRDGMQSLWQLLRVRVIEILAERLPIGGLRVVVRVEETPVAGAVEIRGNVRFDRRELLEAASVTATENLDEVTADRLRRELLRFYQDRGHLFADVIRLNDTENRRAIFEVMEGPLVRIRSIAFSGEKAFPARTFLGFGKHLTSAMELHGKFLFFKGSEYSDRKLRQDLVAVRKYYRNEGYKDAVVECLPPAFNEDGSLVDLRIVIDEGPLYRVGSVGVSGTHAFTKEEILALVQLQAGQPYTLEAVLRDFRAIQRFYGERGFPQHPSLSDSWRFAIPPRETFRQDENETVVDVTYEITENAPKRVREVRVKGNRITEDRVIRRELLFHPGEEVNQTDIENSILALDGLQYFDTTSSRTGYRYIDTPDPSWKDIEIELSEGRTGAIAFAGGISSNDGLFAGFSFTKRNFDISKAPSSTGNALPEIADSIAFTGAGQELVLSVTPGIQLSQFDLRFTEPDLFGDHHRTWFLSTNLFFRVRRYSTHTEDRLGEGLTIGKSIDRNFAFDVTLRNENIDLRGLEPSAPSLLFAQRGDSELRSLRFGFGYRDVDQPIEPRTGFQARVEHETAGGLLAGQLDFEKSNAVVRNWVPLGTNADGHPHTLFFQGRAGVSFPTRGNADVSFSERFFMGGEGTLRGFSFRGVGPVVFGTPVGGEAFYVATSEYRFPLFATRLPGRDDELEILRGVVFVDAGSVGLKPDDPGLGDLRSAFGVGIRVRIPFLPQLPIAIHLGVPWLREKTDDTQLLSFTIGQF